MQIALNVLQIGLAILMALAVLLQQRGAGLGAGFGGDSTVFTTKRGAEKVLYNATIVLGILFFGLSLLRVVIL